MDAIKKLQRQLDKTFLHKLTCSIHRKVIILEGELEKWEDVVKAGKLAANLKGYKGVVNHIQLKGYTPIPMKKPDWVDLAYDNKHVDVAIIGGGIVGCAIARELSKWELDVMVLEKEYDVAIGASSRNDGMVHPGIDLHKGTKKAYYNSRGNRMYDDVTKALGVPFERRGSYILFDKNWHRLIVPVFKLRAKRNDIPGVRYVGRKEILEKEKQVADWVKGGIYMANSGVVSPYKMTIAYAEHAALNGATIALSTAVLDMDKEGDRIKTIKTNRGIIYPKIVVNAAGVYADWIAEMADDAFFTIHPRKGTIVLLDKKVRNLTQSVVAKAPFSDVKKQTKGGGIVRTIDHNILVGPDACETPYREDVTTDKENVEAILRKHKEIVPDLKPSDIITYFSGVRAATYHEDFIVEPSEHIDNLIHACGIQSPGITAAPAIACDIEQMVVDKLRKVQKVEKREGYEPTLLPIPEINEMGKEEREAFLSKNPDYGVIVCRCESISKGEIIAALHRPVPVSSIDGIKRRVRAGMGRCQGGFCSPVIIQMIADECGIKLMDVCKSEKGTQLLVGENKKKEKERGERKDGCL